MGPAAPKIDKVLAANLQKAKLAPADKPYFYALVLKGGGTSGKLLVDRLKIKEQPILDAKKATGGSVVVIGVCYWDRQLSKLVFESTKPPLPTWTQLLKALAKNEAGMSIEPKFVLAKRDLQQIKEPEADKEEQKREPPAASVEDRPALEKWNLQFDALKAKLVEADKSGKPWAKELWQKLSEAGTIYRQGKSGQAQKMYLDVETIFKQKQSAAPHRGANGQQAASGSQPLTGSAPPKGSTGPGASTGFRRPLREGEDDSLAGIDKRLQRLLPAYRAAKAGPNPSPFTKLWESADRFRTIGEFAKGMKELDEFEKLIASGAPAAKATPMATQRPPDSRPTAQAGWKKALAETEPAYLQGLRSPGRGEQAPRGDDLCPEQG